MANPSLPPLQTHHITVDLGKVLRNIERASDAVFPEKPTLELSFTRKGDMPNVDACFIDSVSGLRHILKPALQSTNLRYTKYWKNDQWYVLLSYQDDNEEKQHIMITETDLWVTENNDAHCSLLWRLGYYLLVGLDPYQPMFAFDTINSKMAGYIRCFGAERSSCEDRSSAYEPAIEAPSSPSNQGTLATISQLQSHKALGDSTGHPLLKSSQYKRAMTVALQFAREVVEAAQNGDFTNIQAINEMIGHYSTLLETCIANKTCDRLGEPIATFMQKLVRSPLWLNRYRWYRDDLKLTGCTEQKDRETYSIHVTCEKLGLKFDVFTPLKPRSPQRLTKKERE